MFIILALVSSLIGIAFVVLIKVESHGRDLQYIVDNQLYNSIIIAYAITMIFFIVMPAIIWGFGNFLLPLLVGGPDMAFPRLNNISLWLLPPSWILFIFVGIIESEASIPLAIYALHLSGVCSLLGLMNFITIILNMRSPWIRLHKLTLFGWAVLVTAVLLLLLLPVMAMTVSMDLRMFNTSCFEFATEHSSILYQHFIWFLGHPGVAYVVYIGIWPIHLLNKTHPELANRICFILPLIGVPVYLFMFYMPVIYADCGPLSDRQVSDFLICFRPAITKTFNEMAIGPITFNDILSREEFFYSTSRYVLENIMIHKCHVVNPNLNVLALTKTGPGTITTSVLLDNVLT